MTCVFLWLALHRKKYGRQVGYFFIWSLHLNDNRLGTTKQRNEWSSNRCSILSFISLLIFTVQKWKKQPVHGKIASFSLFFFFFFNFHMKTKNTNILSRHSNYGRSGNANQTFCFRPSVPLTFVLWLYCHLLLQFQKYYLVLFLPSDQGTLFLD